MTKNGIMVAKTPVLSIPASTTKTEGFFENAEIRLAKTDPAVPPPMITKS